MQENQKNSDSSTLNDHYRIFVMSFLLGVSLLSSPVWAEDLGYRYDESSNTCRSTINGRTGRNPDYWGECGNLKGVSATSASYPGHNFRGADFSQANLDNANFEEARSFWDPISYRQFTGR